MTAVPPIVTPPAASPSVPARNNRQRVLSALSSATASSLSWIHNGLAAAYCRWWSRQCLLHPNWCAPIELKSGWYDRMFADTTQYHLHYAQSPYYFLWSQIAERLQQYGAGSVLDVGCGPGQFASLLLDRGIASYVGLDFSAVAVDMARQREPRGRFVVGDARFSSIYEEAACEAIVCTEVLEHIQADLAVVSRFPARVRCFCTVPNFPHESHVRWFADSDEVAERYADFFSPLNVQAIDAPGTEDHVFFLLDGIRNSHIVDK
jgi:SAM-dependent methyltransferase